MQGRRIVRHVLAAAALLLFAGSQASAQTYPSANKITLIVAFAPGGIADTLARLIGQGLSDRLHQAVVVERSPSTRRCSPTRNFRRTISRPSPLPPAVRKRW
jgi:tripartite-type tricarboxylate transporter receptor subunit TctC